MQHVEWNLSFFMACGMSAQEGAWKKFWNRRDRRAFSDDF